MKMTDEEVEKALTWVDPSEDRRTEKQRADDEASPAVEILDILIAARARVARGWTQDALARNAQGREIPIPRRTDVACMCAVGAVLASDETPEEDGKITASMNALLASIEDGASTRRSFTSAARLVASWNDAPERTQADVLAAFDRAIAALEAP